MSGSKGKLICENEQLIWYKNERDNIEVCKTSDKGFDTPKCEKIVVETDGENPQHIGIINNFANAILGLEEQFVAGTDGINGVELMNAIELSGWKNGEEVTLPIDEEAYLSELKKHRATARIKTGGDGKIVEMGNTFGGGKK